MKTHIFVPPGVQMRLFERFGNQPRQGSLRAAAKIDALWQQRNEASEEKIDAIDLQRRKSIRA